MAIQPEKTPAVLMDFSGVFSFEAFASTPCLTKVDLRSLRGTDCYCDSAAASAIRSAIAPFPAFGVHFLDSGNYHYATKFWLEKISRPFSLVVFDHHTDAQPPAWGDGLLSCGGWIADVVAANPNLRDVLVAGPPAASTAEVPSETAAKIAFVCEEDLLAGSRRAADVHAAVERLRGPVYLSVDKDVLREEDVAVNWDQGGLGADALFALLDGLAARRQIVGMDVCGEPAAGEAADLCGGESAAERSGRLNARLLEWASRHLVQRQLASVEESERPR